MKFYLARHAKAASKGNDAPPEITPDGIIETRSIAKRILNDYKVKLKKIYHSPKLRAKQTADIFGEYLMPQNGITETRGLLPNDDTSYWEERLLQEDDSLMLVGHLPYVSILTSRLLNKDKKDSSFTFMNSIVLCFSRDNENSWKIEWNMSP